MNIKHCTEQFLAASGLNYTTFRLCGFMQARRAGGMRVCAGRREMEEVAAPLPAPTLAAHTRPSTAPSPALQAIIGNYAVPILEEKAVWGTTDQTRTAYLDTQDVARMIMAALRSDAAVGRTLPLAGPKAWSTQEVIALCEKLADCDAEVRNVPVWLLKGTRGALRSFQWAADAADRLAFAEVLSSNESFSADMSETYRVLGVDPASVTTLEAYLEVCVGWGGGGGGGGCWAAARACGQIAALATPSRMGCAALVSTTPHRTPHTPRAQEYFSAILKKLKEVGASSKQTNFYV